MEYNILDFVKKYFYNEIDKVIIVDMDDRKEYILKDMTLSKILSYNLNNVDGIIMKDNMIYIKFY